MNGRLLSIASPFRLLWQRQLIARQEFRTVHDANMGPSHGHHDTLAPPGQVKCTPIQDH